MVDHSQTSLVMVNCQMVDLKLLEVVVDPDDWRS